MKKCILMVMVLLVVACNKPANQASEENRQAEEGVMSALNEIAEDYVKLVLATGQHDSDFVDAYYGPAEWKDQESRTPEALVEEAAAIQRRLDAVDISGEDVLVQQRVAYLKIQLLAVSSRLEMLNGQSFAFDEEAQRLYDVTPPTHDEAHFQELLSQLEAELPGKGSITQRLADWRKDFIIPPEKLDAVFSKAIEEARRRTGQHMTLPEGENFVVEYVTDKPWSGYNWYKGGFYSLIQVNTDLPIYIDRAIDLACHEGFPGHHVYNALLEKAFVKDRGWVEFSVYPLFSPQSLVAEGSANYGIRIAFDDAERLEFEKKELFPLAGLDSARVEEYYRVMALTNGLSYAGNEAARNYLDGKWDADKAVDWLVKYALMEPDRAKQRLKFIERYRSYVINYNLGQDLVDGYIKKLMEEKGLDRWQAFQILLETPARPSAL